MQIRRAADSSADFTFEGVELPRLPQDPESQAEPAPARHLELLKWSPESRKFDVLGADQKTASGMTIELLQRDQFRLSRKVDDAERKRLIEEGGIPESAIEKLRNQVWQRVPVEVSDEATRKPIDAQAKPSFSTKNSVPSTKQVQPLPIAEVKTPDISGIWGPFARNEVVIRRAKNGEADFEMTTRLLPRFKKSDPYAEDTPSRRIKWFPEAQHFQTLDPRNKGIASLTMKPNADGKSMHVTVTINGKPVDEAFGKDAGEMEWQRTESNTSIVGGTDSADAARTNHPNVEDPHLTVELNLRGCW